MGLRQRPLLDRADGLRSAGFARLEGWGRFVRKGDILADPDCAGGRWCRSESIRFPEHLGYRAHPLPAGRLGAARRKPGSSSGCCGRKTRTPSGGIACGSSRGTPSNDTAPAWSWFPGTAGWVFPTACTLAALKYPTAGASSQDVHRRIAQGEHYFSLRVCRDGGWNHGSARALGYESDSYPETTGAALVGLRGSSRDEVKRGIGRDQAIPLESCRSSYALSWLELGLRAQGVDPGPPPAVPDPRGPMEAALALIVQASRNGVNVLWKSSGA